MRILVPIDGSDCSERALRFAAEMARRYEGDLRVVHITDVETEATEMIMERAEKVLADEGVDTEPSVSIDVQLTFQGSGRIGKDIVKLATAQEFDHVVMGHHGAGAVDRLLLGSVAKTVINAHEVPVTIIP